ncbi:MAG: hypothetical protein FWG30_04030 [Eubacteriaceae bacterium]|nr:hypothetical protein [Eubacteriaceae bacterium]
MNKVEALLNYWHSIEFFKPYYPKGYRYIKSGNASELSAIEWGKDGQFEMHEVYIGRLVIQDLALEMLTALGLPDSNSDISYAPCCLAGLRLDGDGVYIRGSYSISPFIFAISEIIRQKDINAPIDLLKLDCANEEMDEYLSTFTEALSIDELDKLFRLTAIRMGFTNHKMSFYASIAFLPITHIGSYSMLASSFAQDIEAFAGDGLDDSLVAAYLESRSQAHTERIEIDRNTGFMKKCLQPEHFPYAKWPSLEGLNLMQQIGVNCFLNNPMGDSPVFSIDASQESGQIAVLQSIVAEAMVKRAKAMSEYSSPDDAFSLDVSGFYDIDTAISCCSILISDASYNTVRSLNGMGSVKEGFARAVTHRDAYFSSLAEKLLGQNMQPWSLLCVPYDSSARVETILALLNSLYDMPKPDLENAKNEFLEKYQEVENYRGIIALSQEKCSEHNEIVSIYEDAKKALDNSRAAYYSIKSDIGRISLEHNNLKTKAEENASSRQAVSEKLSWFKKAFKFALKKDQSLSEYFDLVKEEAKIAEEIKEIEEKLNSAENEFTKISETIKEQEEAENQAKETLRVSEEQNVKYKSLFGDNFADQQFWLNIQKNRKSQLACPWTNPEYDILREELFLCALALNKAFILNSERMRANIELLSSYYMERDDLEAIPELISTLALLAPSVCTAPNAIASAFSGVKEKVFGVAAILDAERYSPNECLGALWRSQSALVIGDPMQAAPEQNIPTELLHRFAEQYSIDEANAGEGFSILSYSDEMSRYGSYDLMAPGPEGKLWSGLPLIIQKKSAEPMFSVSNEIAYNNKLFSSLSYNGVYEFSEWVDVSGREVGKNNHYVEEQGIVLGELAKGLLVSETMPDFIIVSPFESVMTGLKAKIRSVASYPNTEKWLAQNCGTVQQMRQKRAGAVVLVLGCDFSNGEAAMRWACSTPNILNSALCMARYRIIVVGDRELWGQAPYFKTLYESLMQQRFVRTKGALGLYPPSY